MSDASELELAVSIGRASFTLSVDDIQKCFDNKKRLERDFELGRGASKTGFHFRLSFGEKIEEHLSWAIGPLLNRSVFLHEICVTAFDENMKFIKSMGFRDTFLEPMSNSAVKLIGWDKFFCRSDLEGVKGLRFQVDVSFGKEKNSLPMVKRYDETLHTDMRDLYESAETTDITFVVGEEEIQAHKHILMERSNYFASMFQSGMKECQTDRVEIKDVEAEIFEEVIEFLYSGLLPNNINAIAMDLLPIADRYEVDQLKKMCEAAIRRNLSVENVIDALLLAEVHDCKFLMASCIPLFKENLKDLSGSEKWKEMKRNPDLLSKLLVSFAD